MKEWLSGRNPVYEALRADRRQFHQLWLARGIETNPRITDIQAIANHKKIRMEWIERKQLDALADHHQGVALQTSAYPYADLQDIFALADVEKESLFVLLLDLLQDPQNFGSLIRTAEAAGVHGVIIPPNRAAGVTPAVVHASSGASEHLLIAQSNLVQAIEALKQNDVWVVGLESNPQVKPISDVPLKKPIALVVGSEGQGLRALVRKSCDFLAYLPMAGQVGSLNAAVAGAIALYMIFSANMVQP